MIIMVSALFVGGSKKTDPAPKTPVKEATVVKEVAKLGEKAALLDGLTFVKGDPVTFKEGKVYVVEFWATWSAPCRTTVPHLTKVQKEFKNKGVTVIGITAEKEIEKVKTFITKQADKMDYTIAVDPNRTVSNGYMKAYARRGIPSAFIVDQKGRVAWIGHPKYGMDDVLKSIVAGKFDLAAYIKAEAANKAAALKLRKLFIQYNVSVKSGGAIKATRLIADKIMDSAEPSTLEELALGIVNMKDVDDSKRDYETAMNAICKANDETKGNDLGILNTFALVLAKKGQLKEAISFQQKTVGLAAGNKRMKEYLTKQLEKYQTELIEKEAAATAAKPAVREPKRLWADSYLWAKAPKIEVEKWLGNAPDTKGKYVLLEIWTTWCSQCVKSIPDLNKWQAKYADELAVIGISDEGEEKVKSFTGPKIKYFSGVDTKGRVKKELGVRGFPHVIIIEPGGYVVWEGFPYLKGYELTEELLEKILAVGRKKAISN